MSTPTVSVIIPVYNREQTIRVAVNSVLLQSYADFELLVIDDCSTDNTTQVVRAIEDPRLRLVLSPRNQGPAGARNRGIREARGEFIAFLDSDDRWLPDALERMVTTLSAQADKVGVLANHYLVENGVSTLGVRPFSEPGKRHFLKGMDFGPGSGMLVRRIIFDQIGGLDERLTRGEDWEWVIRAYQAGLDFTFLFEPVAIVERSNYTNPELIRYNDQIIFEKHSAYFEQFGEIARRKAISHRLMLLSKQYFQKKQTWKGMAQFIKAHWLWPFHRPGLYALIADSLLSTRLSIWANRRRAVALPPEGQHGR